MNLLRPPNFNAGVPLARRLVDPRFRFASLGVIAEFWADQGVTLGTTPRAAGTSPPAVTWSGQLKPAQELYLAIDSTAGGTARGQATFKWSIDGGSTFVATGVVTAATTDLATPQGTVTVAWPVGTYNTDQTWKATVAAWDDLSYTGNNAVEATASRQVLYSSAGFNGRPCLDWGVGGSARGLSTPSLTIGPHSLFIIGRGDVNSEYAAVHINDGGVNGSYTYCFAGFSTNVYRGSVVSSFNVTGANAWFSDGVRRSVCVSFDGTHAGHALYRDAVAVTPTGGTGNDPGTTTVSGALHIGRNQTPASTFRGVMSGIILANRAWTSDEVATIHAYAIARFPL